MRNTKGISITILIFLLISCANPEKKWDETKNVNTIAAYEEYILQFPSGVNAKEAKTKISNIVAQLIIDQFINSSLNQLHSDYPVLWNGKTFDKLGGYMMHTDLTATEDGSFKPIPNKSKATIYLPDNSLTIECKFINEGNYKLTYFYSLENSIVQFKSGIKYTYRNGQFEK
jgi:hypothetical protein